jgi:hypothetical protein
LSGNGKGGWSPDSHHPLQIDPEVRNALSFKGFFSKWFPNGSLPKEPFEEPFFMPKPYLLARPSGLYVRFRVPRDLSSCLGFGSIVRSLHGLRGDAARLSAALQAVALSGAFDRLRKGAGMADVDLKKLLAGC